MRRLVLLGIVAMGLRPSIAQDVSIEYRVKAAYLYNFVKFVEWPEGSRSGPINICVAGHNPFGAVLADTVRGESVGGRPLAARVILEPEADCQVLFVPEGASTSAYLRAARGAPTLTVGESADFLNQGGIIAFINEGHNVRFAISADAADQAKLQVSSRLLRLAVNTQRDSR